ncbi:glycosyltransferase [Anabaena sp. UHCC 0204]|uniref:glycosyltransferase n=1 Tax=Anabaena sp. UHCC 0204 TaxID=2590009 RepID=UPI001447B2B7|nr:glycosyltransferase [Anabaena sp. UHCC 0204]MTJ06458.1 glycosyltransferase [Anabaena sp. UHCC 0204]
MKKNVIIYRDQLIPYSETFIPAQVENFSSHTGFYVGNTRLPSAKSMISPNKTIILGELVSPPELWKTAYKLAEFCHPNWIKHLQALSPILIHAHFGLDGVLALPLAKKLNIPLIVTFHGYYATADIDLNQRKTWYDYSLDYLKRRGQFYRELYIKKRDRLFQEADCFIAVSEFIRSKLIEKGCPPEKIKVHYIGIDIDKFTSVPNIQREPVVLFVGRFVEKKGCEYLIRAMAQVQKIMPNVELVMIGDGPLRSTLENIAANSLNRYRFLGVQPPEIVKEWMTRSFLLCAPSITTSQGESEGLPIVILEAMAMGLPVISSVHAGIPEAIIHEQTGLLTQERDWEAIAKSILTLLEDQQLRDSLAIAGRSCVEQKFNLKSNTAQLEETYNSILGSFSNSEKMSID